VQGARRSVLGYRSRAEPSFVLLKRMIRIRVGVARYLRDPCRSLPILADPCRSLPIVSLVCDSRVDCSVGYGRRKYSSGRLPTLVSLQRSGWSSRPPHPGQEPAGVGCVGAVGVA
jgi:hypothetical protein